MSLHLRILCVGDVYTEKPIKERGGYAQLAQLVNARRADARGTTLTVVTGDMLGGSSLSEYTKGKHVIELLNAIQVDCGVIGCVWKDWPFFSRCN